MADEIANSDPTPVAPAEAPSVEVTASPAVIETPAVEAPATETPAEVEAPKPDTLLAGEKVVAEEEKTTPVSEEEVKPVEETPAELPTYEPFTLPEGAQVEPEKMGEFTKELAEFETKTKVPHEEVQALGQMMVDRHISEMKRYTESLTHAWEKQKTDWKDAFLKDPEFANRTDTVVNSAIDAIGVYAGSKEQQDEFRGLMESTGIGNHPAMIRLLSNIMIAKAEPKPLAAPQIASAVKGSKIERMYGSKKK